MSVFTLSAVEFKESLHFLWLNEWEGKGQCTELHPACLLHYYSGDEPIALQKKTLCGQPALSGLMSLILIFYHCLSSQQNLVEIVVKSGTKWGEFVITNVLCVAKWVHFEFHAIVLMKPLMEGSCLLRADAARKYCTFLKCSLRRRWKLLDKILSESWSPEGCQGCTRSVWSVV